jgi:type VI secretion system protein ImpE
MNAHDRFKAGQLAEAIAAQTELVKQRPTDADARFEMFVFLCFAGELERAEKHLDALETRDGTLHRGTLVFRNLLASELERRRVFEGRGRAVLPPKSPGSVEQRAEALGLLCAGDAAGAQDRLDQAIAGSSAVPGRIDGQAFDGLCDYDDLLGDVIEVFAGGRYLWLPLEHLRVLELSEASTALDTLWIPGRLEDRDGETAQVHVPALYAGSHAAADPIRLGRETEWDERGALRLGRGQRVWISASGDDVREHAALSVRRIEVQVSRSEPKASGDQKASAAAGAR